MFIVLHLYHVLASLRVRKSSYFQANVSSIQDSLKAQFLYQINVKRRL